MSKYLGSTFGIDVRALLLTGLSTATSAVITAADSVLGALGKLQAQVSLLAPKISPSFTGTATATALKLNSTGWLETAFPGSESAFASGILSMSSTGAQGGQFAMRSSDNPSAGAMNFALGSFVLNNNTTQLQTSYGAYFEARRYSTAGTTQGLEVGTVNFGNVHEGQPYYLADTGSTLGLWLSAGRSDVTPNNDITSAIGIVTTGGTTPATFRKGIIFGTGSLASVSGIGGVAMALPVSYAMVWYSTSNVDGTGIPAAFIRSSISSASGFATPPMIDFTSTGLDMRTADGVTPLQLRNTQVIVNAQLVLPMTNGTIELGNTASANTPFLDFHSSGNSVDYDVRVGASGGTAVAGNGKLTVTGDLQATKGIIAGLNVACGPNASFYCTLPDGSGYGAFLTTNASGDAIISNAKTGALAVTNVASLNAGSSIEVGSTSVAGTSYVDLHSSGFANDYDVRVAASGGSSGVQGGGTLTVTATLVSFGTSGLNLGSQTNSGATVAIALNATGSGTDLKRSQIFAAGSQVLFQLVNDAQTQLAAYLTVNRSASAGIPIVSSMDLGGPTTVPDLNVANTGYIAGAWASTTGAVSASTGTLTGSAAIRYRKIGRTVHVNVAVTSITNTSGTGTVQVALPWTNAAFAILNGRENTGTGKVLQGFISSSTLSIVYYDNTFPGATGNTLYVDGTFEATS